MFAAALLSHREALGMPSYPNGMFTADQMSGLVYCSDMAINQGAKNVISDAAPTGSRVSSTGLILSTDMVTLRDGKLKNFADLSEATDATLFGSPTLGGQTGIRGVATAFDGSTQYATSPDNAAWQAAQAAKTCTVVVVCAWDAIAYNQYIFRKDGHMDAYLFSSGTQLYFRTAAGGSMSGTYATFTPVVDKPYVLAFVQSPTHIKIYIDGVCSAVLARPETPENGHNSFGIAASPGGGYYMDGDFSNVRVWGRTLSDAEIRQLYEDEYGWIENKANPHCKDISTTYPLGSDRIPLYGNCKFAFDGHTSRSGKAKNMADSTGTLDGTLNGGVTLGGGAGAKGATTLFDGTNDYIGYPSIALGSSVTVRVVVKKSSTGWNERVIDVGFNKPMGMFDGNKFYFEVAGATGMTNGGIYSVGVPIGVDGLFHELVLVLHSTSYEVYHDGVLVEAITSCTFPVLGGKVALGSQTDGGNYCECEIAEAEIWNAPLTSDQVANLHVSTIYDHEHPVDCVLALDMETLNDATHLKDFSGAGNHATIVGPLYKRGTIKNGTYLFDGGNDRLDGSMELGTSTLTLSAWFKTSAISGGVPTEPIELLSLLDKGYFKIYIDGKIRFYNAESTYLAQSDAYSWVADTNYHVVYARNGDAYAFYVNGVLLSSGSHTAEVGVISAGYNVGFDGYWSSNYSPMTMSALHVLTRALSATEVQQLYIDSQKMLGILNSGHDISQGVGQVGRSTVFEAVDRAIFVGPCPALDLTAALTLGAWVKPGTPADIYGRIFDNMGAYANAKGYLLCMRDTGTDIRANINCFIGGASNYVTTPSSSFQRDKWGFLVGTWDGSVMNIYANGVGITPVSKPGTIASSSQPLCIGNMGDLTEDYIGAIAFPFIFDRALSAAEIAFIYRNGKMARW